MNSLSLRTIYRSIFFTTVLVFFILTLVYPFFYSPVKKIIKILPQANIPSTTSSINKTHVKVVLEAPLHNVTLPDFAAIRDVKSKKRAFFDFIYPAIVEQNNKILVQRQRLDAIAKSYSETESISSENEHFILELAQRYLVNEKYSFTSKINVLQRKVDVVPTPLVMVQAANESAWGTSRFAKIGLNFFGIWCYRPGCGMVPNGRNSGARHEVAAFESVDAAVKRYLFNINTHNAYGVFRIIRSQLRSENIPLSSEILATGLIRYSERRGDYVVDLTYMLRQNKGYFSALSKEHK